MDQSATPLLCETQDDGNLTTASGSDSDHSSTSKRSQSCCCKLPGRETMAGRVSSISSSTIVMWLLAQCMVVVRKFWAVAASIILILVLIFWLYGSLVALALFMLAIIGLLYNVQDRLLYYPDQPPLSRLFVESPSTLQLPHESTFMRTSDGVKIHLVLIKQPPHQLGTAPTVILLHGNAGNIGHRLVNAYALYTHCGCNILLVEYRGYGRSQGSPTEQGLYLDCQAAIDYISSRSDINQSKLVLFGRSLGGAVAIKTASLPYFASKLSAVVVENTFTTLPDIGKVIFDVFSFVPNWCFKNKYLSLQHIGTVRLPTLFMSGLADTLVPPRMVQQLYDVSGSHMKRMARFETGTHNETWQCQGYYETINRFLLEVEQNRTSGENGSTSATYSVQVPFDDGGGNVYNL